MNLLKKLSVAFAAVAMPTMAFANPDPTIIHISGSSAFRAPVTCAIINALGGTSCRAASNKSGATSSNQNILGGQSGIFANGTVSYSGATFTGSATIVVLTNWTGSLAGVLDVAAHNAALTYPNPQDTAVESAMQPCVTATFFGGGGSLASGFSTVAASPEVCMTDSFASSAAAALSTATLTGTIAGKTTGAGLKTLINSASLVEAGSAGSTTIVGVGSASGYLGIVPFQWVVGNTATTTTPAPQPTNITQQVANYLIKNGVAPMSMFNTTSTGTLSGSDFLYLVGRNEDSGTRVAAFAEPQLSFTQAPQQFLLTFSGGAQTTSIPAPTDFTNIGGATAKINGFDAWPANATLNTQPLINWASYGGGHGGYTGGGDLKSVLSTPVDQTFPNPNGAALAGENTGSAFFIGYLGIADSGAFGDTTGAITGGKALTYNGVTPSVAGIQNGSYSFWSYEHMYYISGSLGSTSKTFVDGLADSLSTTYVNYGSGGVASSTAPAGVFLQPVGTVGTVTRTVEGGGYTLNY